MRCFLTMLGVIIGVGAVIAMLAIGQGSKNSIKAQISEMGSNMIMIMPGAERRGGVRQSSDDMQTLKPSDYDAIVNQAPGYHILHRLCLLPDNGYRAIITIPRRRRE